MIIFIGQLNFTFQMIENLCILLWIKMHQILNFFVYIVNIILNLRKFLNLHGVCKPGSLNT